MEQNLGVTKHFFKVLSRDFHTKLVLPKTFCRNLNHVEKLATIRSGKGIWEINLCRSNGDTVFFEKGWSDFVRQHDLTVGDIVVFEHTGEMNFRAFVFDFTACEKEFDRNLGAIKINGGASCQQRDNPYFVITIKQHNSPGSRTQYVRIPAKFWRSNGLNEKTSVNLRDPFGKKWPVELKFHKNGTSYNRVIMLRGWKQFYESSKLKNGDVCTFVLNHNPKGSTVASMDVHIKRAPN